MKITNIFLFDTKLLPLIIFISFCLFLAPIITTLPITNIKLTQIHQSKYVLKSQIANLNINILAYLQDGLDWIKEDGCLICSNDTLNQLTQVNNKQNNCDKSCFADSQYGLKCSKSYCKIISKTQTSLNLPSFIKQGTKVMLSLKQSSSTTKIQKYPTILAEKLTHNYPQIGRINLLNGDKGLFGNELLIVKDHDKDITVYYYNNTHSQPKQPNQQQSKPKQNLKSPTSSKTTKQQNQPLYKSINILYEDNKNDNQQLQGIIIQSNQQMQNHLQYNNQSEESEQRKEINVFEISQIKLREFNNFEDNDKYISNSEIPLIKSTAKFSLKTNKLLLPPLILKKFTKLLIDKYFISSSQSSHTNNKNNCQFTNSTLKCTQNSILKLQKLQNITITILINGIQIQFPIRALIQSCTQNSCKFLLGISKNSKQIIIGDYIFNIFAIKYQQSNNIWTLYRLNNQWSKYFKSYHQYSNKQHSFFFMIFILLFNVFWWLIKIILYISIIVLFCNCIVHFKQIISWFMDIFHNVQQTDHIRSNIQEQNNYTFNKMKNRIKNRIQNVRKHNIRYKPVNQIIQCEREELQFQQKQQKKEKSKLINPNQELNQDITQQFSEEEETVKTTKREEDKPKARSRIFSNTSTQPSINPTSIQPPSYHHQTKQNQQKQFNPTTSLPPQQKQPKINAQNEQKEQNQIKINDDIFQDF